MELYNNIANTLSKKSINLTIGNMYDFMAIWKQWYRGDVNDFHYYKTKMVNGTTCNCERLTMNMAKKTCEDITKLLWTEKTEINLSNKKATKRLWEVLESKENNFTVNFPIFLEKGLALGNGALVEYKKEGKTIIDYIEGDVVIPYKYTNSYINGVITLSRFTEQTTKGKTIYYTHITYHEYDGKEYKRYNELYKSMVDTELGKEMQFETMFPDVENPYIIKTTTPHFQLFKPNLANNLDLSNPMGISIYANSLDRFKSIDTKYDSFANEFELGKKRILVDNSTLKAKAEATTDGEVKYVQYFDSNDKVYVAVEGMEKQPAKEIDFTLRTADHIDAINADLNWLADNVGLGEGWYKFDGQSVKTATEVISENSKAFRTRTHHLINVNDVVYDMVKAICELEGIQTNNITIKTDDSIIEDKNAEQIRAMQEVSQGLMSKKEYLIKIKGMSEQEADEELQKIQEEKMSNQEAFGFETNTEEE